MKKFKKLVLVMSIMLISLTALSGCRYSEEELKQRDEYIQTAKDRAKDYVKEKYGTSIKIKNAKALTIDTSPVPDFTPPFSGTVDLETNKGLIRVDTDNKDKYKSCKDDFEKEEILEHIKSEMSYQTGLSIESVQANYGDEQLTNEKLNNGIFNILKQGKPEIYIETIDEDIKDINIDALRDKFGYNVSFYFLDYRNKSAYNNREKAYQKNKIDNNKLLYNKIHIISENENTYKEYNLNKVNNIYTATTTENSITVTKVNDKDLMNKVKTNLFSHKDVKAETEIYRIDGYINDNFSIYIENIEDAYFSVFSLNSDDSIHSIHTSDFEICNHKYLGTTINQNQCSNVYGDIYFVVLSDVK